MWEYIIVPIFLVSAFLVGSITERAHFRRLDRREEEFQDFLVTDTNGIPAGFTAESKGLVTGEVVVASDYFKTFVASLKKIIGGRLGTLESLVERARREALLRVLESAKDAGANCVVNVRFATTNVGATRNRQAVGMVELYAYGTAVKLHIVDVQGNP